MSIALHLAVAASDAAPLASGSPPDIPWGRIILAFLFCIVLAIVAIGFIRVRHGMPLLPEKMIGARWKNGDTRCAEGRDRLQIVQRLGISPTSQIIMMTRGKHTYILHVGNHGASEIDRYCEGDDAGEEADKVEDLPL